MAIDYRIRKTEKEDIPAILNLIKELAVYERLSDQVSATEDKLAQFGYGDKKYFEVLLAEIHPKQAVGFAFYFFTFSTFLARPILYLEDLFVMPQYRGFGIGKALLKKLANIALEEECGRMEWSVLNWNTPAIEFYLSIDAVPMSEWTTYRLNRNAIEKLSKF
jgi:GNAT superfamily N-acetyltransferase